MDLNHDKQIQSLLCYRYTIGQSERTKGKVFASGVKFRSRACRHDRCRSSIVNRKS
jgi:hypothetical protein